MQKQKEAIHTPVQNTESGKMFDLEKGRQKSQTGDNSGNKWVVERKK